MTVLAAAASAGVPNHQVVWKSGVDGYHTYRIPAVLLTKAGTLIAACEGRVHGRGDAGDIDLVVKLSHDMGRTWGAQQVVWDEGDDTCGNPCLVEDADTGIIWMLLTRNPGNSDEEAIMRGIRETRTAWVTSSADDGKTWEKPREITSTVKPAGWTWYATGPGVGIQVTRGVHKGRLVIPCDHARKGGRYYSHVIVSDDHGKSWRLGGLTGPDLNECQVVELSDGRLMLNLRNGRNSGNHRAVMFSSDAGSSWSGLFRDQALPEPVCQASLIRVNEELLAFSNPATTDKREKMTVKFSADDGKTWPRQILLHEGPSAYSCLVALPDGQVGCLYERGEKSPYESIVFDLVGPPR